MQFVHRNLMIDIHRDSVFYQLAIAGEITEKKLSSDLLKLLPSNICEVLRNVRDNLLTHSGYTLAVFQTEIFHTLQTCHIEQFDLLASVINKIIIRGINSTICTKLRELTSLENNRFSKLKSLVREIENIFNRIQPALQALPSQDQEKYALIQREFVTNYEFSLAPLREAISSGIIAKVDIARTADSFKTNIKKLENISRVVFEVEELPTEILEFCHSIMHYFDKLTQQAEMRETSPQILQERKKTITLWIKRYSTNLYSITENLQGFNKQRLINSVQDLEVQITQYNARWHLIMLNALLEEIELRSTTLFYKTRNKAIHQFENIDPNEELHSLGIICGEDLSPFITKQKEATVASNTVVGSPPTTADTPIDSTPISAEKCQIYTTNSFKEEINHDGSYKETIF